MLYLINSPIQNADSDVTTSICGAIIVIIVILLIINRFSDVNKNGTEDYVPSENVILTGESSTERLVNVEFDAFAQRAVQFAKKYGHELDFSLTNIDVFKALVKHIIEKLAQNQVKPGNLEIINQYCGAYLGEVIRRKWGGDWIRVEQESKRSFQVIIKCRGVRLDPLQIIRNSIQSRNTSIIDEFIQEAKDILDIPSQEDVLNLFEDEESYGDYFVFWNNAFSISVDVETAIESLQEFKFPFGHHSQASITEIIYIEEENRQRIYRDPLGSLTIDLPPYIFERKFKPRAAAGGTIPLTLILGGNSERSVAELMIAVGFRIVNDIQPNKITLVDKKIESTSSHILWHCPRCQEKNKTQIAEYDTIVRCDRCHSSFRCLIGEAKMADCHTSRYLSTEENYWVVRISIGLNQIKELTFKTASLDFIIRKGDSIIAFLTNNGSGDVVASIENRTTYKSIIL